MRLASPALFLALLGVSLVTGLDEVDKPGNLRRTLADDLSVKTASGETKALALPALVSVKDVDPWDEPDTLDTKAIAEDAIIDAKTRTNGDKAADLTTTVTLPTDAAVAVGGAKESDPWDEPDSEDGRTPPSNQKDGRNETQAVVPTGEGGKSAESAVTEGAKHEDGYRGGGRGRYDDDYNDNGWRYGGDRRFDRCVRFCQQHCYRNGRYRYCPNRCYGWCHHQLGY